jgi:hypothetical protein
MYLRLVVVFFFTLYLICRHFFKKLPLALDICLASPMKLVHIFFHYVLSFQTSTSVHIPIPDTGLAQICMELSVASVSVEATGTPSQKGAANQVT